MLLNALQEAYLRVVVFDDDAAQKAMDVAWTTFFRMGLDVNDKTKFLGFCC